MYIQLKLIADLHVSKDNFDQSTCKIMFMRISKFKCITICYVRNKFPCKIP